MKYIKNFEGISDFTGKKFWTLPTDERFEGAMNKIGAGHTDFDNAIETFRALKQKYIIIYNNPYNSNRNTRWNYMGHNENSIKFLESEGYENMGTVDIPQYELDMVKYNL